MKIIQESSYDVLLKLPHRHVHVYPTGFVVRTNDAHPSFPFTVCPLWFCKPDELLPGINPHDVIVEWNQEKGSLETLLYTLYEKYKAEGIARTEESVKRYVYNKRLPPRKIIIPTLQRRENLEVVLRRFQEIDLPAEGYRPPILVVEHSPFPEFESLCQAHGAEWIWIFLDPRMPHLPIGQFNKALCYDKAYLFGSPAQWYLFHDNDVLVPKDFWSRLDANVARAKTKFIQPYTHRSLLNLHEEFSKRVRSTLSLVDSPISPEHYSPIVAGAPGGSLYIHHDRYLDVGGHDPNICWGYGPEDLFFFQKLSLIEPIAYADDPPIEMIHLWHPRSPAQNPFYFCMDFLIKAHYKFQSYEQMKPYLTEKRATLELFLPALRKEMSKN